MHRAYADAAATAEVLHALLERAAAFGVLGLDDLLALPTMRAHPSAAKLALTAKLPRLPGVYLFRDRGGRVLYVGKATNLRARVRSYFSTEDRRKVPQLLRETVRIEHRVCRGPFEAAVRELRLIQRLEPRFNRAVEVVAALLVPEAHRRAVPAARRDPRRAQPTAPRTSGRSARAAAAHRAREAIEDAVPLRRCGTQIGRKAVLECGPPCVPAQLGVVDVPVPGPDRRRRRTPSSPIGRPPRPAATSPPLLCAPLEARMQPARRGRALRGSGRDARPARDAHPGAATPARDGRAARRRAARDRQRRRPLVLAHGRVVLDDHDAASTSRARPTSTCRPRAPRPTSCMLVSRWLQQARHVRCHDAVGVAASRLPAVARYAPVRDD